MDGENDPGAERDFFLRLLDLESAAEPEPLLAEALETIVAASGARAAYIELRDVDDDGRAGPPRYSRAHGCTDEQVESIRAQLSRAIIALTLAGGETVATPSAVADPAFRDQPSVMRNGIQAVLCAPIGSPPFGVVYLEGAQSGDGFTARNRRAVELFARQLAVIADRVMMRRQRTGGLDATADIRRTFRCEGIVGGSEPLAHVLKEAAQAASLPITVLLSGPTGTGKSALARAIHANSPRAKGPYIDVNCAAIPEALIESELFGAEAGSFTGATKKLVGKVTAARGGTLFLDEVGELSRGAQAKLLQLLQEQTYYPVGSSTAVRADVRVISATNVDLRAKAQQGQFRPDLYYRLAVATIELPSLAARRDDIPALVEGLCREVCKRNGVAPALRPTRGALLACREAQWEGNIRELGNALEVAVMRAHYEKTEMIEEQHIFPSAPRTSAHPTFREATQRSQRRIIEEALLRNEWNVRKTSEDLDISRQYLHEVIVTFGLKRPAPGD